MSEPAAPYAPPVPQRIALRPATSPVAALTMIAWYVRPARCGNAVTGLSTAPWRVAGGMAGSARGSGARWRGVRQGRVASGTINLSQAMSRRKDREIMQLRIALRETGGDDSGGMGAK